MTTAIIYHPACRDHFPGEDHPEAPNRISAIDDALIAGGLEMLLRYHLSRPATTEELLRIHTESYLKRLQDMIPSEGVIHLEDGDTGLNPHSYRSALLAAGSGILATDLVLGGECESAFCNVRPPGHHAGRDRAMGFCLFNNIALAAAHALEHHHLARVAVLDFDVHHGNGTEDIFLNDNRVLVLSIFQHPFFPWSDEISPHPNMHFTPLPAGTKGEEFVKAVREVWVPALRDFAPEMIFLSAGFDGHALDPTADLLYTEVDYYLATELIRDVARETCKGRIVSILEGGYDPGALGRSVAAHLKCLLEA